MTIRSVILGLLLALLIAGGTYYNDWIIHQASLINHLFPLLAMGSVIVLVLIINPILGAIKRKWLFKRGELVTIFCLGLAACTWPGAGFYRTAITNMIMPSYWEQSRTAWKSQQVMAYVPGGDGRLAPGHVRDWNALLKGLVAAADTDTESDADTESSASSSPELALWRLLDDDAKRRIRDAAARGVDMNDMTYLTRAFNRLLRSDAFDDDPVLGLAATGQTGGDARTRGERRAVLVEQLPEDFMPAPAGDGVLPNAGRYDADLIQPLRQGMGQRRSVDEGFAWSDWWRVDEMDWAAWWPIVRLWGGLTLLIGLACLCMAAVVHPQWAHRELLAYPIARFLNEAMERDDDSLWPRVARSRGFWVALILVLGYHLLNGLHAWYPNVPSINNRLNLLPLNALWTELQRQTAANAYLNPFILLSATAFAFFLNRTVSFSLGMAPLAFLLLASFMAARGNTLTSEYIGFANSNMLRFGGYLGMLGMMVYIGRRYYGQVFRQMLLGRSAGGHSVGSLEVPGYSVWAARIMMVLLVIAIGWLTTSGLDWFLATICVLLIMLTFLVIARIAAETGLFFIQAYWLPVAMVTGLLGYEAIGPTAFILLGLASTMIVGDPRTALMSFMVHALKVINPTASSASQTATTPTQNADQHACDAGGGGLLRKLLPVMAGVVVLSFLVAGAATLNTQLHSGVMMTDMFTRTQLPSMPFNRAARYSAEAAAEGTLSQAVEVSGVSRLLAMEFDPTVYGWMVLGLALVVGTAVARLRVAWWPLHPVIFLVWGTYPINKFAFSFLLGYLIKEITLRVFGARGYRAMVPIMVGVIAAELLAALGWSLVGLIYHLETGKRAVMYLIF